MKTLVIAEKPSVASDIARSLGKVPKKDDHFENDEYVVSSAVGHLVELFMPEDIDKKKYGFWRLETLPIIPEEFGLKPIEKTKDRFSYLKKLLARKDITAVVNACDAGREGELIFAYIYQLCGCKKPVQRLWMSSMTADGIRSAFKALRPGESMQPLRDAARSRSESDWLIGINGTRAVTKRLYGSRAGNKATVGRVQTPTLAIVMQREREIRAFKARTFHRVTANFKLAGGEYEGVYERPNFKKGDDEHDRADRIWQRAAAEAIAAATKVGATATVTDESKRTTQSSQRLYDLTSLQRDANNRFSFPARKTLQVAQSLYEKHKMITYPRTDSKALPEDYIPTVRSTLERLEGELAPHAQTVLKNGWVRPNKRIFNNAEVTDHFAIIPTNESAKDLDSDEQKIFDMIARRFVGIFFPPAQIDVTTRTSQIGTHIFKSEGKVLVEPGYLAVAGRTGFEDGAKSLPPITAADGKPPHSKVLSVTVTDEATKPPPRYTEATLLSAMEGAGKFVDDDDLAEAMSERGLGTPATRAATIEHLIGEKYLSREQRELVPTAKAETVLDFLSTMKIDTLTKPALTGDWEFQLRKVEQGQLSREKFMAGIVDLTRSIVTNLKEIEEQPVASTIVSFTDGKTLKEFSRWWESQDGLLRVYRTMNNRRFSAEEVSALVEKRELGPFDDFVSDKSGKRFTSKVRLEQDAETGKWKAALDLGNKVEVGSLAPVWESGDGALDICQSAAHYICRKRAATGPEEHFRISRLLCRKELPLEQIVKIAEQGKTDVITDFISRFNRPFSAFLVLDLNEKNASRRVKFEFPPRAPKEKSDGKDGAPKAKRPTIDLSGATSLGASPAHKDGELLQAAEHYVVRRGDAATGRVVFKVARKLCAREITVDEVKALLENGTTELLTGFTSKRGNSFDAFLKLSKDKGKAEFEFEDR